MYCACAVCYARLETRWPGAQMPAKLKFRVVHCSSEDPEFPSTELNAHSPHTVGWQSARFCDYPQEIGFQFAGPVHLMQLQVRPPQLPFTSTVFSPRYACTPARAHARAQQREKVRETERCCHTCMHARLHANLQASSGLKRFMR